MDAQLAAIYGTNQGMDKEAAAQVEAEAEYIAKVAAANDIDLDQLSEEQLADFAGEVLSAAEGEQMPDESQKKIAEADFLGRVMAHAYNQELEEIEKQAAEGEEKPNFLRRGYAGAKRGVSRGAKAVKEYHGRGIADIKSAISPGYAGPVKPEARKLLERLKSGGKGAARFAPHAAALTGAALLARHQMKKKSAAEIEKLAEEQALGLLYNQGWIDDQGNLLYTPGQTKEAEGMTAEQAVEIRALQMLEENGFPVQWNE